MSNNTRSAKRIQDGPEGQQDLVRAIKAVRHLLTWLEDPKNWKANPNPTFAGIARVVYIQTLPNFQEQQNECITVLKDVYSGLFDGSGFGYSSEAVKPVEVTPASPETIVEAHEPARNLEMVEKPEQIVKPAKKPSKNRKEVQPNLFESETGHEG